ncbi:glycoside hydrolase superfamily [Lineolata rhizophorae]|uniref:glucan 1,3-beta-glucosidase n=1 Tax=Lineolata rhizophorae TaxID=578093 RepID=A0A6A6PEH8_9PEZI|nr:glycoside hydrolase superfamily [Lineolata rhizophorae]
MSRLRQYGINTVRIPIGYWAYDNSNTPFIYGAPGSQNGFQNSGREGSVDWQKGMNLDHTTDVLKTIAAKYGKWEWSGTIVGIELQLVMHDSFLGPSAWLDVVEDLRAEHGLWNTPLFSIDAHYYRVFGEDNSNYNQDDHINATCQWAAAELAAAGDASLPAYVGEFSAVTNICVNPDGTTTGGMSCSTPGCQCQTMTGWQDWDDQMVAQVRRFVEAQLDAFEAHSQGYFLWSLKAPNGWGFLNGIEKGFIPNPLTSRQFGQLC